MTRFAHIIAIFLLGLITPVISAKTPIMGKQQVEIEKMYQYVSTHNPDFSREVAEAFFTVGERYGVRGDIALCQAIIETGWFRFDNGTAVRPDDHNYCGLGVKKRGDRGCSFSTVEEGVTAMVQHLYAYCCKDPLPSGEDIIDPRFGFVSRGAASTWEALSGKWAMNHRYGDNILRIYKRMSAHKTVDKTIHLIEVNIPDEAFLEDEEIAVGAYFE
ncbi:MAG: glucosaminidase domain-containing protein [Muribaculaceae bacterium]|nr:glucosaminidase domain-containing protein [Muribaculaceae bacterium]